MHAYRTHTCAALSAAQVGEEVRISGWVHRKRDHGGLLFIDLRDHYGLVQIVCDADSPAFATLESVRTESVLSGELIDDASLRKDLVKRADILLGDRFSWSRLEGQMLDALAQAVAFRAAA